jgi:hypothetical protein
MRCPSSQEIEIARLMNDLNRLISDTTTDPAALIYPPGSEDSVIDWLERSIQTLARRAYKNV